MGRSVKDAVERGLRIGKSLLSPALSAPAPVQNIGAYGTEVEHSIDRVEAFDIETGKKGIFKCRMRVCLQRQYVQTAGWEKNILLRA